MSEPQNSKKPEVDHSMLEQNLKLTPQQRIQNHQAALDLLNELKSAGQKYYAESKRTSKTSS